MPAPGNEGIPTKKKKRLKNDNHSINKYIDTTLLNGLSLPTEHHPHTRGGL